MVNNRHVLYTIRKHCAILYMGRCYCMISGDTQVIPMGTYDYSFAFTLPPDLPSSFSGEFGHIKYAANVVICIPRWPNKKFLSKFFVIKPLNLNHMPSLRVI